MGPTPDGADLSNDLPPDDRPYGTRPYGTRPYGTRPYGTRPYGTRPYGTRPYGTRPHGTGPYGTRPEDGDTRPLDPQEWSEDVAELFAARSALIRLGARLVTGDEYIDVPAVEPQHHPPRYLGGQRGRVVKGGPRVAIGEKKPVARVSMRRLWPGQHELAWKVVVPDAPMRTRGLNPDVAWAIKDDIARGIAVSADREFLAGQGGNQPYGIASRSNPVANPGPGLENHLRELVRTLRTRDQDLFERAGWVLHPGTLDEIASLDEAQPTWDSRRLLEHDGVGGGLLLGYPFVVSAAASRANVRRIFFSSDWGEAWIGAYPGAVQIDVSFDAKFQTDETVIRAVLRHDFEVRREALFVHAQV
jgi:Phage capsid family